MGGLCVKQTTLHKVGRVQSVDGLAGTQTDARSQREFCQLPARHPQVGRLVFLPSQFLCLLFLSPAVVWWPELPRARRMK